MTYNETAAIVYRIVSAYPFFARHISDEMIKSMVREWHEGLKDVNSDGAMEAVTMLVTEQKWMPSLSEVVAKIIDVQFGTNSDIIRDLDRIISGSSTCIIFGQVTQDQIDGYNKLSAFQKLIVHSPDEFNMWLTKSHEWKDERVGSVKREVQFGRHKMYLNNEQAQVANGFDVFKALEEKRNGQDQ